MPNTILQCTNIKKSYTLDKTSLHILSGINLNVNRGEICVITGRSGTGKSTLLSILGGIDSANSGTVVFHDYTARDTNQSNPTSVPNKNISFIFQNFNLIPTWTALENIEAPLVHTRVTRSQRRERVVAVSNKLGIGDRLAHMPSQLSIGQAQRVAIARALVTEPQLLLADEPAGDVDPQTADELKEMILNIVKERKLTLIVVTHGQFMTDCADQIYRLQQGNLIEVV